MSKSLTSHAQLKKLVLLKAGVAPLHWLGLE